MVIQVVVLVQVLGLVWGSVVEVSGPRVSGTRDLLEDFIISEVSPDNIRTNLRYLTQRPHLAGTEAEEERATWVEQAWRDQGMDEVHRVSYDVLLSYPRMDTPNLVRVLDEVGEEQWVSQGWQPPLYAPEESTAEQPPNFNAYSGSGNVSSDVVYAFFGREDDFDMLEDLGVNVTGKIVLARYGEIFRANIAQTAERRGAVGLLLYADPQQYAPFGPDAVYPNTVYLPSQAVPTGTVKITDGDPLTPFYPSIDSAFRIPEEEAELPHIPVQPISYEDANQLLGYMGGQEAPLEWQGGLNLTYRLGPGLAQAGWQVGMEVYTSNQMATIHNVVGMIQGSEEPDRYVVVGNHRDAWMFGGLDPSSGTAAMMELARVLLKLRNETGWTPRRTVVLCSWGAEEYGLIGSQEWVEQFSKQLGNRAVAYLNADMSIQGNYTMRAKSAPLLYDILFDNSAKVPNPDPAEVAAGRLTLYDTWAYRMPDSYNPGRPAVGMAGSGSDYRGFQHNVGVPSLDIVYTHGPEMYAQPLYHTLYETFALVDELFDRGFFFHTAITQLWALLALDLTDSNVLPMSLVEYGNFVQYSYQDLEATYGSLIASQNLTLNYFSAAVTNFQQATTDFTNSLPFYDTSNPLVVRRLNDQMMMVERAFIDPLGLPGRPDYNHVVVAPSVSDSYSGTAFAGLTDALDGITELPPDQQEERWRTFSQHLAAVTHLTNTAAAVLTESLW